MVLDKVVTVDTDGSIVDTGVMDTVVTCRSGMGPVVMVTGGSGMSVEIMGTLVDGGVDMGLEVVGTMVLGGSSRDDDAGGTLVDVGATNMGSLCWGTWVLFCILFK